MKFVDSILFFIAGGLVGIFGYQYYKGGSGRNPMPPEKQQIVLEKIKKVAKLITAEGEYADIHEFNDYYWSNISIFSKKALVRVKAKVSVGYDLERAKFEADSLTHTITVTLPEPQILSIDDDLQYYDMHEGMFNSFSEEELSSIQDSVKAQLTREVMKGPLMEQVRREGPTILKDIIDLAGWKAVLKHESKEVKDAPTDSLRVDPPKNPLDKVNINVKDSDPKDKKGIQD